MTDYMLTKFASSDIFLLVLSTPPPAPPSLFCGFVLKGLCVCFERAMCMF